MMYICTFERKNVKMYALYSSVRQEFRDRSDIFFSWLNGILASVGIQKPGDDNKNEDEKGEKEKEDKKNKRKSKPAKGGGYSGNKGQDKSTP